MQQKLHEQVVKLRKIYEGLRLAILEIIRAVCVKTAESPPQKSGSRHRNPQSSPAIEAARCKQPLARPVGFQASRLSRPGSLRRLPPPKFFSRWQSTEARVPPFHGIAGEKSGSPATDKTAAIPEATRRAVLRHYPRPGQRAQRAAVRGRKRSAQLSSQIRGRRFKTRLGPGMIPPSKKSRTVPSCPRFGEDAEVNKP
jgi:hypothetical protein